MPSNSIDKLILSTQRDVSIYLKWRDQAQLMFISPDTGLIHSSGGCLDYTYHTDIDVSYATRRLITMNFNTCSM